MATKNNKYSGRKLIRSERNQKGNYTQISNSFVFNPEIGNPELRLLLYIMSNKDDYVIKTKNCMMYLNRTKPVINRSFKKLIALGILIITDDIIEVVIPEEMKKYKVGYLKGNKRSSLEVKKTLPSETEETTIKSKENLTTEVKKTLPNGKENYTPEVKKTYKKPLESIDNEDVTNPITLNNTRVLPVPAASGNTEQSHSNHNTKTNTGIELDLECDSLQSQASPSVLAPSLHTPKVEIEKVGEELSLPMGDNNSKPIPIEDETFPIDEEVSQPTVEPLPIEPDERFAEQLQVYNTSKYFLPEKFDKVKSLYNNYAEQYPNEYLPIMEFEMVLVYLMTARLGMVKIKGINFCLLYHNDICHNFKIIPQLIHEMLENPDDTKELLRKSELKQ